MKINTAESDVDDEFAVVATNAAAGVVPINQSIHEFI